MEHEYILAAVESGRMDSISFSYNCNEEKKGELIYYSEKGEIRLIKHIYNEYSHFSATDQYFVKDDRPFFVFYNHMVWSFIKQNETRDKITEKRFYIINNEALRCLEKEFTQISNEPKMLQSNEVANREVECTSLGPVMEDFELYFNLKKQNEDITCLEN